MIKTPFKRRENSNRTLLMLIMVTVLLDCLSGGSMDLFFYFVREKLYWTLIQYTWYSTITSVLGIFSKLVNATGVTKAISEKNIYFLHF